MLSKKNGDPQNVIMKMIILMRPVFNSSDCHV